MAVGGLYFMVLQYFIVCHQFELRNSQLAIPIA
jgi:hypothetical protein